MSSTKPSPVAAMNGPGVRALLLLALLFALPVPSLAQGHTALGLRGGAGLTSGSRPVYAGQVELVDVGVSSSVEVAVTGWTGLRLSGEYSWGDARPGYSYPERFQVWGFGLVGSYLWRHARRGGPYALFGIGVGPVWVDWRADSADARFGTAIPGGSFRAEKGLLVGSLLTLGLGQRLHDRLDVRAQVTTLIVPPTEAREDVRKVPMLTLTSGIGL